MFWNYNQTSSPQIDNVFCKEDLMLQELLDQENILQELKSQNKKLIDFLIKPDVLSELVTLIITEPSDDIPEDERYKHANIACELLTTDIPCLTENLAKDINLVTKLYSLLESEPPLNPLLASFFSRTMGVLIVRRSEQNWYSYQFTCLQVFEFLKTKEDSIPLLLKHLGTSAIMDLALKLITQIEWVEVKNFMVAQEVVGKLIQLLSPSAGPYVNANSALLICDIIVKTREAQQNGEKTPDPDPILSDLESSETIKKMLEVALGAEKKESSIVGIISILLVLLDAPKPAGDPSSQSAVSYSNSDGGGEGDSPSPSPPPQATLNTIEAIIQFLPAFYDLLLNPPHKPAVKMTFGVVDPPLGNTRLQVIKLLVALVATYHQQVHEQLVALDFFSVILDLFFKYSWNNFLHTQVEKCLNKAIAIDPAPSSDNPADSLLIHNIFVKCRLLQRILDAWKENDAVQGNVKGHRKGYMGHLTTISFSINSRIEKGLGSYLTQQLQEEELTVWTEFTNGPLAKIKEEQSTCLGGKHPALSSSDDDDKNYRNIPFNEDIQLRQVYSEFQSQQMAPYFTDKFGLQEGEDDGDEPIKEDIKMDSMLFNMADDELDKRADMFNKVCAQRLQCLDEDDDDEDVWADSHDASRVWNGGEEIANFNSSDDEERPGPEGREEAMMEIDQVDPWLSATNVVPVVGGPENPWAVSSSDTSNENEGWADFESNFTASPNVSLDVNTGFASFSDSAVTSTTNESNVSSNIMGESRSDPLGASTADVADIHCDKQDNNAIDSTKLPGTKTSTDEDVLIDNFRFLSSQGLMSVQTACNVPAALPTGSSETQSPERPTNIEEARDLESPEASELLRVPETTSTSEAV